MIDCPFEHKCIIDGDRADLRDAIPARLTSASYGRVHKVISNKEEGLKLKSYHIEQRNYRHRFKRKNLQARHPSLAQQLEGVLRRSTDGPSESQRYLPLTFHDSASLLEHCTPNSKEMRLDDKNWFFLGRTFAYHSCASTGIPQDLKWVKSSSRITFQALSNLARRAAISVVPIFSDRNE